MRPGEAANQNEFQKSTRMYRRELREVETHWVICTKNSQCRSISKRMRWGCFTVWYAGMRWGTWVKRRLEDGCVYLWPHSLSPLAVVILPEKDSYPVVRQKHVSFLLFFLKHWRAPVHLTAEFGHVTTAREPFSFHLFTLTPHHE